MFEPGVMTGRVLKDLFEKTATGRPAIRWPLKMNEMPTRRGEEPDDECDRPLEIAIGQLRGRLSKNAFRRRT